MNQHHLQLITGKENVANRSSLRAKSAGRMGQRPSQRTKRTELLRSRTSSEHKVLGQRVLGPLGRPSQSGRNSKHVQVEQTHQSYTVGESGKGKRMKKMRRPLCQSLSTWPLLKVQTQKSDASHPHRRIEHGRRHHNDEGRSPVTIRPLDPGCWSHHFHEAETAQ